MFKGYFYCVLSFYIIFLISISFFPHSNFKSLLWISDVNPLYVMCLENIFSKFIKCFLFCLWIFMHLKNFVWSNLSIVLIISDFIIVWPLVATRLDRSQDTWHLDQNYEVEKEQGANWKCTGQTGAANICYRKVSDWGAPLLLFLY